MARKNGTEARIVEVIDEVKRCQTAVLGHNVLDHFQGALRGRTIALGGLAFRPRTDDICDAPPLVLIDRVLDAGAARA